MTELTPALVEAVLNCSREAGQAIMEIYRQPEVEITTKADQSPVTTADLAAHAVINRALTQLTPDIPQLSEEAADIPYATRKHWQEYWLIDPLDGTKEFIHRNDEFTVNIALIRGGKAVLGVVYQPVTDEIYWGIPQQGAWYQQASKSINQISSRKLDSTLNVIGSRRHGQQQNDALLAPLQALFSIQTTSAGSSLKMCRIAAGSADFYPRLFPTSEWDTAAAQAVVEGAGGVLVDLKLQPLSYNQKESLLNPWFLVAGDPEFPFRQLALPEEKSAS